MTEPTMDQIRNWSWWNRAHIKSCGIENGIEWVQVNVDGLDDFEVYIPDGDDVFDEIRDALSSHLQAYKTLGRSIPDFEAMDRNLWQKRNVRRNRKAILKLGGWVSGLNR